MPQHTLVETWDDPTPFLLAARALGGAPSARSTTARGTSAGSTHRGQRRSNQDYLGRDDHRGLYAVADGVGGEVHGEHASRMAVELTLRQLAWNRNDAAGDPEERLAEAFQVAREAMCAEAWHMPRYAGMSTTLVVLQILDDGRVVLGHLGDSRAYRLRGGTLTRLTSDHTLANDARARSYGIPDSILGRVAGHLLTRSMSTNPGRVAEVESTTLTAEPGDLFLLCTDGLSKMLSDDEIRDRLCAPGSLEDRAEILVRQALAAGGRDNVTVVLAEPSL